MCRNYTIVILVGSFLIPFAAYAAEQIIDGQGTAIFNETMLNIHGQLVMAAIAGRDALVAELKNQGADINQQDEIGETPLMRHVFMDSPVVFIENLLKAGARVTIRNNYTQTVIEQVDERINTHDGTFEIEPLCKIKTLLEQALKKEKMDEKRQEAKKRRYKEIYCVLLCHLRKESPLSQLPKDIIKLIHHQLRTIDEAEIVKAFATD